jgi:NAD(P)-dependent dehydrogenase (short-subunit alcohol dehydrogenase family)
MAADLNGRVAVVTGASSGLGRRFAEVLAGAGARVALIARRAERLAELAAVLGDRAVPVAEDIGAPGAAARVFDTAEAALGPVDILVNNAGMAVTRPTVDLSEEEIEGMFAVNVRGPLLFSREFARRRIAARAPGRIVNVSSIGAFVHTGAVASQVYSITKAAVTRMTEVHALEWARHEINVNAIAPGVFATEIVAGADPAQMAQVAAGMRRGRLGQPRQLDTTLLYLVDPGSEFVTGTVIKVDDAQMAR